jgi:hypothetical protein
MKYLILIAALAASFFSFATVDSLPSDVDLGRQYITQLKNGGALIVRLKSRDKNIAAYRNAGNTAIADEMQEKDRNLNRHILNAFRDQFRFCPVYFIYARSSKKIMEGERDVFLNDALLEDTSIKFNHSFFLFVDFGTALINESVNSYTYTNQIQEGSTPGNSQSYTILDTDFKQLHSPFPYLTMLNFLEQNPHQKAIARMNKKMFQYLVDDKMKQEAQSKKKKRNKK